MAPIHSLIYVCTSGGESRILEDANCPTPPGVCWVYDICWTALEATPVMLIPTGPAPCTAAKHRPCSVLLMDRSGVSRQHTTDNSGRNTQPALRPGDPAVIACRRCDEWVGRWSGVGFDGVYDRCWHTGEWWRAHWPHYNNTFTVPVACFKGCERPGSPERVSSSGCCNTRCRLLCWRGRSDYDRVCIVCMQRALALCKPLP